MALSQFSAAVAAGPTKVAPTMIPAVSVEIVLPRFILCLPFSAFTVWIGNRNNTTRPFVKLPVTERVINQDIFLFCPFLHGFLEGDGAISGLDLLHALTTDAVQLFGIDLQAQRKHLGHHAYLYCQFEQ